MARNSTKPQETNRPLKDAPVPMRPADGSGESPQASSTAKRKPDKVKGGSSPDGQA